MNNTQIAQEIIKNIAPFLPTLMELGKKGFEKIAEKVGEDAWGKGKELGKVLWSKLRPKIEAEPKLLEAAKEVAEKQEALQNSPEDPDAKEYAEITGKKFQLELRQYLSANPTLTAELEAIFATHNRQTVEATGESVIENVEQSITGKNQGEQIVRAADKSKISGVKQNIQ